MVAEPVTESNVFVEAKIEVFAMKARNQFSVHNLVVFGIVLSLCFVFFGCSSKSDKDKITEQTALIKSLQEEITKLRSENNDLEESLAKALNKIKEQADLKLYNEEIRQLKEPNDLLKKILAGMVEKTEEQPSSELYYEEMERLKQENDELRKLLAKAIQKTKEWITFASSKDIEEQIEERYKEQVEAVMAGLDLKVGPKRKMGLIKSLTELSLAQDTSVIDVVQKALDDPDPKVGRAAITLLEDYETTEILPVISQALQSRDEQTRIDALVPLANVNNLQVVDLVVKALNDTSEEVRSAALQVAREHADDIQLSILEAGIIASYKDVKSEALSLLEDRSDHSAVEIIITGLGDKDPKFREEVNSVLYFLIDREFKTYEAARLWWDENKYKYDEGLFEIVDEDDR